MAAALDQTFTDFEIVVVDNDSPGSQSSEEVTMRQDDSRVRHLRTGGLGMAENWQTGVDAARGEYVLLCSDKLRLLPWLLEEVDKLSSTGKVDAVVWQIGDHSLYSAAAPTPLRTRQVTGSDIMDSAAAGSWRLFLSAGARGMTSVFSRKLGARVREELGFPICRQVCPDFTIALSLAALGTDNVCMEHVGAVFLPEAHGNGYLCLTAKDEAAVNRSFEVPNLDFLPTKYMAAVNGIYHDIISTINALEKEKRACINWEMYFVNLVHEAVDADDLGGFSPSRREELVSAIQKRSLKFRLSLFKTILWQEATVLTSGRRKFSYQLGRMLRLLRFPAQALVPGRGRE